MTRRLLGWVVAVLLLTLLALRLSDLLDGYASRPDDFVQYWAAARVLVSGGNPYSPVELEAFPKPAGWNHTVPFNTWTPPWALVFALPFAFFSYPTARLLALITSFALLFLAGSFWLRHYLGAERHSRLFWLTPLLVFGFYPVLVLLNLGQIGALILAGLTGWFHFMRRQQWMLAGLCLCVVAIKPHLVLIFGASIVLWTLHRHKWSLAVGAFLGAIAATSLPLLFNASLFRQYLDAAGHHPPVVWATSTIGAIVYLLSPVKEAGLLGLPCLVAVVWTVIYWKKRRSSWDWGEQLPVILLVSVIAAPFAWHWDQVILLPVLMQLAGWTVEDRGLLTITLPAFMAINLGAGFLALVGVNAMFFFWMAPALLVLYLAAKRRRAATWVGPIVSATVPGSR